MQHSDLLFVLLFVASLQIKHFVCDGPLQTLGMVQAKGQYGKPLGLAHAAIHCLGSGLVLLGAGLAVPSILGLALLDFAVHYHVDFSKEQILRRMGWTTRDALFWWTFCADQGLHHLTYLLLAYLALKS
jgi:hypothetical protein